LPKYLKPSFTSSHLANPMISLVGAAPVLGTRGRRSGQWRRVPVNVIERDGSLYLVAPRGYTHWARNLLANPEAELRRGRRTEKFQAVPVPIDERLPLISTYLDRWGDSMRGAVRGQFEQLPDPADHPAFRLVPSP
jgi:deazaflavin-dependent oxidoreductase (nitroreductase family)